MVVVVSALLVQHRQSRTVGWVVAERIRNAVDGVVRRLAGPYALELAEPLQVDQTVHLRKVRFATPADRERSRNDAQFGCGVSVEQQCCTAGQVQSAHALNVHRTGASIGAGAVAADGVVEVYLHAHHALHTRNQLVAGRRCGRTVETERPFADTMSKEGFSR